MKILQRLVKWAAIGLLLLILLAAAAIGIGYWRSTNDCGKNVAVSGPTMNAIVYCQYGDASVLRLERIAKPVPNDDQVLVKVHAASVNPYDWHFMRGSPYILRLDAGLRVPKVTRIGGDFAGVIEAVGRNVTRFKPGDEVFGNRTGAFAEYQVVRAEGGLALKPPALSFAQAAGLPIAGVTALQALRGHGKLQAGQRVLINGASGGVGTLAVQLAKDFGGVVTGVCSTRNVEMVLKLGADQVVDYTKGDVRASGQHYDLILDLVGNLGVLESRRLLTPKGQLLIIGAGGPDAGHWIGPLLGALKALVVSPFVKQDLGMFMADMNAADLKTLADFAQAGKLTPVIDRTYPLAETAAAIRYLEQGHARGKVIIAVADAGGALP